MSRPLRLDYAEGWYSVTARGKRVEDKGSPIERLGQLQNTSPKEASRSVPLHSLKPAEIGNQVGEFFWVSFTGSFTQRPSEGAASIEEQLTCHYNFANIQTSEAFKSITPAVVQRLPHNLVMHRHNVLG